VNGVVVSVEFEDLLALTLWYNHHHFEQVLVVSSPGDVGTRAVAERYDNARLFTTDAFYRNGAYFNKGAAIELALRVLGNCGWILLWDADILMPKEMKLEVEPGYLYSPHRRLVKDPRVWTIKDDWTRYPMIGDCEFAGYFQLFHTDDPVLKQRPWYPTGWNNASGCDTEFQNKWPADHKIRLPFEVLHLGSISGNWCGRCSSKIGGWELDPVVVSQRARTLNDLMTLRKRFGYRYDQVGSVVRHRS
jgi:hypothetical protein